MDKSGDRPSIFWWYAIPAAAAEENIHTMTFSEINILSSTTQSLFRAYRNCYHNRLLTKTVGEEVRVVYFLN